MEDVNKKQQKYEQLLQFGTNEQRKELVFEDMDIWKEKFLQKHLRLI